MNLQLCWNGSQKALIAEGAEKGVNSFLPTPRWELRSSNYNRKWQSLIRQRSPVLFDQAKRLLEERQLTVRHDPLEAPNNVSRRVGQELNLSS